MDRNLPTALSLMFGHEGGYSNNPKDPGGPTKFGITHKTLAAYRGVKSITASAVQALTLEEAAAIYKKSYWPQSTGSAEQQLADGLDYMAFDFGVNSGPSRSVKTLQALVGVTADGIIGAQTITAAKLYPGGIQKLIRDYADARMRYLQGLSTFGTFGRGWTIRVTGIDPKGIYKPEPGVIGNALKMNRSEPPIPAVHQDGNAKSPPKDTSLTTIIKKPEAWAPLGGLISALGSTFSGSGPVQWALAAAMIAGVGVGVYYIVKRVRSDG